MVLFMVLVLVIIGASIMAGVYGVINPFVAELGNIQRYNQAYYGAIAGVERAELVLRGHEAGFEGSGGWINGTTSGPSSDHSTISKQNFGFLALTRFGNGVFRKIKSMTNGVVPEYGKGNLNTDISSGNNYEKLTFDHALQYALYKDTSNTSSYYTGVSDNKIENIKIDGELNVSIRVPFKLACIYNNGGTCSSSSRNSTWTLLDKPGNVDLDNDGVADDIIVNRSLFGYTGEYQFTVFPSINLNSAGDKPENNDTSIREDVINYYVSDEANLVYDTSAGSKDSNPNEGGIPGILSHTQNVNKFNQSPEDTVFTGFDFILNSNYGNTFNHSKTNGKIGKMNLKLSLINLLKYDNEHVYPYLEVKLTAKDASSNLIQIPDLNFHITGEGKVMEYDVKILISKPVFNTSTSTDFTVLF